MTLESQTAAVGTRRRPTPPRAVAVASCAGVGPATYVPEEFDPKLAPARSVSSPGHFGLVYPAQRTPRGVWLTVLVLVASVAAFVGWRAQHSGASDSSSGLTYTSSAGHFAAHFPSPPSETSRTERHGRSRLVFHTAAVQGEAVIAEVSVAGKLPAGAHRVRDYVVRQITTGGLGLTSVKTVSVHGTPARQGNLVQPTGEVFTVLVVAPSAHRYFVLAAPLGSQFDTLKNSFRILK